MFEYSKKGLPHALMHGRELVETYGHHGACCTCVGEAGHKLHIKMSAKFARVYGDKNETEEAMLEYVQREAMENDVIALSHQQDAVHTSDEADDEAGQPLRRRRRVAREQTRKTLQKLDQRLDLMSGWSDMHPVNGRPPRRWGATFLRKRLLITRVELITLVRTVLEMSETWENITLLATQLQWECFGVAFINDSTGQTRKVVGISRISRDRRDFVRINGCEDNTALSVQVCTHVTYTSKH